MSQDRAIPPDARREIDGRLLAIEREHDVRVLLAVESGSRAWGFASADSDFDVRFLYLRRPAWYLSLGLEGERDVIETPIEGVWDVNGWDLRKALRLLYKSNPPLLEWLRSPIVYREHPTVMARMRELAATCHSPTASMHHYLHMARGNFRSYLQGPDVWLKKYFYVLRPVLACRWVEAGRGAAPMEFERLVEADTLPDGVREAIDHLLASKRAGNELRKGPAIPVLHAFLSSELERLAQAIPAPTRLRSHAAALSTLFRDALTDVWGVPLEVRTGTRAR